MSVYNTNERNTAIDVLRLASILAVILIHTTTKTFEITGNDLLRTPLALFLNQAARFAVPLFFMISGFVLEISYHHHPSLKTYLKSRVSKILLPYIVWSAIYHYVVYRQETYTFLEALFRGTASYQLYFIPTLLLFYISFPGLHRLYQYFSKTWVMIALGGIQLIILYVNYHHAQLPFFYPINVALFNFFIFILGMVAARNQEHISKLVKRSKVALVVTIVCSWLYMFFEGRGGYFETHNYLSFYSQWRPSVLVYTVAIAGVLYHLFRKNAFQRKLILFLSSLSYFVYFLHVIVMEIIWRNLARDLFPIAYSSSVGRMIFDPFFFIAVAGCSFFIASLVHRSKLLTRLLG